MITGKDQYPKVALSGRMLFCGVLLFLLTGLPRLAPALGLGKIEVFSGLNEPLDARIELLRSEQDDLSALQARLADLELFEKAGIQLYPVLYMLRFEVEDRQQGVDYILLRSAAPIREPFLNFLILVNWTGGRLVKEYTMLLDPPNYPREPAGPGIQAAPHRPSLPAVPGSTLERPLQPILPLVPPVRAVDSIPSGGRTRAVGAIPGSDYSTRSGDTLWAIAIGMRPDRSISIQQMMHALLRRNPHAFFLGGNINALKTGQVLQVPSAEELRSLDRRQAMEQTRIHNDLWQQKRSLQVAGRTAVPPPVPPPVPAAAPSAAPQAGTVARVPVAEGQPDAPASVPAPVVPEPTEQVRVLIPDSDGAAAATPGVESPDQLKRELALVQEELQSKEQQLGEFSQRLQETEAIAQDLQRMIELKDAELSRLQQDLMQQQQGQTEQAQSQAEEAQAEAQRQAEEAQAEAQRQAEEAQAEAQRQAEEAQRQTEAQRQAAEAQGQAEAQRQAAEAQRQAEEAQAEAQRQAEEAQAEAQRQAEEAQRQAEAEQAAEQVAEAEQAEPPPEEAQAPAGPGLYAVLMNKAREYASRYGLIAAGAAASFVLLLGGLLFYRSRRRRAEEESFEADALTENWVEEGEGDGSATETADIGIGEDVEAPLEETMPLVSAPAAAAVPAAAAAPASDADTAITEVPFTADDEASEEADITDVTDLSEFESDLDFDIPEDTDSSEARMAEVNVLVAYGQSDRAIEFVREALEEEPDNPSYHLKLLEIYSAMNDLAAFEQAARTLQQKTGGSGEYWELALNMWKEISPGRELFAQPAQQAPDLASTQRISKETAQRAIQSAQQKEDAMGETLAEEEGAEQEDEGLEFDLGEMAEETPVAADDAEEGAALEFDLGDTAGEKAEDAGLGEMDLSAGEEKAEDAGLGDMDLSVEAEEAEDAGLDMAVEETEADAGLDMSIGEADADAGLDMSIGEAEEAGGEAEEAADLSLDMARDEELTAAADLSASLEQEELGVAASPEAPDLSLDVEGEAEVAVASEDMAADLDMDDLSVEGVALEAVPEAEEADSGELDLDIDIDMEADPEADEGQDQGVVEQLPGEDIANKLDLARAYIELGDADNARLSLEEVVAEGDENQQQEAERLLTEIS